MAAKPIFVQAVDTNGAPYSGAKLNVYDAGTTTPRAIYTESGLGTASANPAIADANGVVVVWVNDAGGDIKVTLTNSAETVTPHNEDNVPIASLTCYPVITFQGDQSLLTTSSPTFAGLTLGNVSFAGVVTDPNADRLVFWDDSASQVNFMTLGAGLAFNGTALELDVDLQDISGLTPTDGGVIIGDGTRFVVESGATLRTSIGLGTSDSVTFAGLTLASGATVTAILDEDDLASDSAAAIPTQQSVKAYADSLADTIADINAITQSDGAIIVSDGANWVGESGATARASLGVSIDIDVQAYDAGLASIAGLTTAADKMLYTTGLDTYAVATLTPFARTMLDDTDSKTAFETVADSRRLRPSVTAIELLNLSPGVLVYEDSGQTPGMTEATVQGICDDANALGITKLTISYAEYQGFWFYNPTINFANGTGDLTFSATSGASVTVTSTASEFSASDVGSLLIKKVGTSVYRAVITGYTSATQVTAAILNSSASVAADISTLLNRPVQGVTSIPADGVSAHPLASTSWTAAGEWEKRYFPWDYETSRYGFFWRDAANAAYVSLGGACEEFTPITTIINRAGTNSQTVKIGIGRSGDVSLLNDIVSLATKPSTSTVGSRPGALISAPLTDISGSPALTSASWTSTTVTSTLGAFLSSNVGQEIHEVDGDGRAIIRSYTSASSVSCVIIKPFTKPNPQSGDWEIRSNANIGFRSGWSVLNRAYDTLLRAQEIASDLNSQYGANSAFDGWYISHEPDHITRCSQYFFEPLMNTDLGDGSINSYSESTVVAPSSPIDLPAQNEGVQISSASATDPCVVTASSHTLNKYDLFQIHGVVDAINGNWTVFNRSTASEKKWMAGEVSSDKFEVYYADSITITGITAASPGVVTTSSAHGLSNGDTVLLKDIAGMTELNGRSFTVANATSNTFELGGEDTSSYTAYASGGAVHLALDASAYAAWSSHGGYVFFESDYIADQIVTTKINIWAPQGSMGYGHNFETNTNDYVSGQPVTLALLDQHFSAWRALIDLADAQSASPGSTHYLWSNTELWQIYGVSGGVELPPGPTGYQRVAAELRVVAPYVDEMELYALFSYAEQGLSGTADRQLRNRNSIFIDYGIKARKLYDDIKQIGFWRI